MTISSDPSAGDASSERFDDVVREYIDFVNAQVGAYMDALAGFSGHYTRVQRQVHRISRPSHQSKTDKGESVVVWASYEDPSKPDIIHNRIIRAEDYLTINARGGSNEQQHARAIIVFLYTAWESDIRPRLAKAKGAELNDVCSDIMGDLKHLRHAIIHARGVLKAESHRKLKVLGDVFMPDQPVTIPYEEMHTIFVKLKQDCARLMFEWLNISNAAELAKGMKDVAIQTVGRRPADS